MAIFSSHFKHTFALSRRTLILWIFGVLISFASSISIFIIIFFNYYHNRIYQGIYIHDINVGGLTKNEALHELKQHQFSSSNKLVILQANELQQQLEISDLVTGWQYEMAINQALKIGHQEKFFAELKKIFFLLNNPQYISLYPQINIKQI